MSRWQIFGWAVIGAIIAELLPGVNTGPSFPMLMGAAWALIVQKYLGDNNVSKD